MEIKGSYLFYIGLILFSLHMAFLSQWIVHSFCQEERDSYVFFKTSLLSPFAKGKLNRCCYVGKTEDKV